MNLNETNNDVFINTEILVCVGSGGVGKTTVAASLGVLAAQKGKKVLVLTIDPSKRLASTLGIEGTTEITKVPGQQYPGELFAAVIDHQKTFEEFVLRAAKKSPNAVKILNNKLFQRLSNQLSGSQDFTALEKLFSCHASKEFELIILDTPPMKHALDFLNSPQKLAALFNEKITKWFRDPRGQKSGFFRNLLSQGTRQVLKILETMTGSEFVDQLVDFFSTIETWQAELFQRTVDAQKMLMNPRTKFCLVSQFDEAKMREAEVFAREIRRSGFHLGVLILNRAFPDQINLDSGFQENKPLQTSSRLLEKYELMREYFKDKQKRYLLFLQKLGPDVLCLQIPDFQISIDDKPTEGSSLRHLEKLAGHIHPTVR